MRIEKLEQLAAEAFTCPNYKYKSREECQIAAQKSFNRLTEVQKKKVGEGWMEFLHQQKLLDKDNLEDTKKGISDLIFYRYLAQTNLFFLCKVLEKYSQVTMDTHEEICNRFFVKKDPTFPHFEAFAIQYSDLKDRMLLVPRGGFKSSIDIADCVQWIICFPAVTILILTGVYKLAGDFVGELRQHFTLEENGIADAKGKSGFAPRKMMDRETGEWSDSLFQILFREHCLPANEGTQFEFQTPASVSDGREPTVRAASIEQALSGMHFGVLKLDDVVTNENCLTVDRLQKVNKQISVNRAMLHPYGFQDVIGTWYDIADFYGLTIKQEETFAKEQGMVEGIIGSVDSGRFESNVYLKVYLRAAWWPTEDAKKAGKIEEEMKAEDWVLWFPSRLPYEFLIREKKKDPDGFAIKYLNNPRQMQRVKFPRELLMRRTISHNLLPQQGIIVSVIDTAYSVKSWADYTVIITALIYGGRFYIINMVRGRFNEFELPQVIAASAYKWKPKRIAIEDSMGVKWMGRELRREMDKLQISVPVEFISLGLGSKKNSKQMKAKPVARLFGDERMLLVNSCEGLQEIYTELEKFTGTVDDAHDDIVSALSLLAEQFGAYADMDAKINFATTQFTADMKSKERHDLIYGLGKYTRFNAANLAYDDNPVTAFQLEQQTVTNAEVDPLSDLM